MVGAASFFDPVGENGLRIELGGERMAHVLERGLGLSSGYVKADVLLPWYLSHFAASRCDSERAPPGAAHHPIARSTRRSTGPVKETPCSSVSARSVGGVARHFVLGLVEQDLEAEDWRRQLQKKGRFRPCLFRPAHSRRRRVLINRVELGRHGCGQLGLTRHCEVEYSSHQREWAVNVAAVRMRQDAGVDPFCKRG